MCITPCAIFASHRTFTRPDWQEYPWDRHATFIRELVAWNGGHPNSLLTETQGALLETFEVELNDIKERVSNAAAAQAATVAELKQAQEKVRQITCTTAKRRPRSPSPSTLPRPARLAAHPERCARRGVAQMRDEIAAEKAKLNDAIAELKGTKTAVTAVKAELNAKASLPPLSAHYTPTLPHTPTSPSVP